jgi:uncharacterized protein YrrD
MANEKVIRRWSELKGLKVTVPSEGRNVGEVEDFYFQLGTNSIYALCVRTRLEGIKALPSRVIEGITSDAVIIKSEEMLSKRIPPYPLGTTLLSAQVKGEDGKNAGVVADILIRVIPIVALHVAGYEIADASGRRSSPRKVLDADAVTQYDEGSMVIDKQTARRF